MHCSGKYALSIATTYASGTYVYGLMGSTTSFVCALAAVTTRRSKNGIVSACAFAFALAACFSSTVGGTGTAATYSVVY